MYIYVCIHVCVCVCVCIYIYIYIYVYVYRYIYTFIFFVACQLPQCLRELGQTGLGMSLEMDVIDVPGATGDYHSDLSAKAKYAISAMTNTTRDYDLGFVHVKAVDDAGHDKNLDRKVEFLQKADSMILELVRGLAAVEEASGDRFIVCVTGDHSTPVAYGDHSADPVPFSIAAVRDVVRHLDQVRRLVFSRPFALASRCAVVRVCTYVCA